MFNSPYSKHVLSKWTANKRDSSVKITWGLVIFADLFTNKILVTSERLASFVYSRNTFQFMFVWDF